MAFNTTVFLRPRIGKQCRAYGVRRPVAALVESKRCWSTALQRRNARQPFETPTRPCRSASRRELPGPHRHRSFPSPGPRGILGKSHGVVSGVPRGFSEKIPWGGPCRRSGFRRDGSPPSGGRKAVPGYRSPANMERGGPTPLLECGDLSPLWLNQSGAGAPHSKEGTPDNPLKRLSGLGGAPPAANFPDRIVTGRFPLRGPRGILGKSHGVVSGVPRGFSEKIPWGSLRGPQCGFLRKPHWGVLSPLKGLLQIPRRSPTCS